MTAHSPRLHSVPAFPPDLQTVAIQRRLGVSPSVARAYADHAFGDRQRSDFAHLASVTANRVAASSEARG